ncbi:unnamed protein product [Larinioides sclopetarius]|uniref:Uncharacterized protein n=1 Tax=Larinioides sclopetarius TaxID=280406 RepID=A0AAV2B0G7_9ARAC
MPFTELNHGNWLLFIATFSIYSEIGRLFLTS